MGTVSVGYVSVTPITKAMPAIVKSRTRPAKLAAPSAMAVARASAMRASALGATKSLSVWPARLAHHRVISLRKRTCHCPPIIHAHGETLLGALSWLWRMLSCTVLFCLAGSVLSAWALVMVRTRKTAPQPAITSLTPQWKNSTHSTQMLGNVK